MLLKLRSREGVVDWVWRCQIGKINSWEGGQLATELLELGNRRKLHRCANDLRSASHPPQHLTGRRWWTLPSRRIGRSRPKESNQSCAGVASGSVLFLALTRKGEVNTPSTINNHRPLQQSKKMKIKASTLVGQGKRGVLVGGWPAAALKAKITATGRARLTLWKNLQGPEHFWQIKLWEGIQSHCGINHQN